MSATAEQIASLRRKVAEKTDENGYTDAILAAVIVEHPVIDSAGRRPYLENGVANSLWVESYDLNAAAADVWEEKAAALADKYDMSADGATLQRSKAYDQAMRMAARYRSKSCAEPVVTPRDQRQEYLTGAVTDDLSTADMLVVNQPDTWRVPDDADVVD